MNFHPRYQALGIGSLPYTDPRTALDLIRQYLPDIPHWPQLPKRGRAEHFIHQCLNPLIATEMITLDNDHIIFDETNAGWEDRLTDFYGNFLSAQEGTDQINWFGIPYQSAVGFYAFLDEINSKPGQTLWVKGQLAGPLSVALNITDRNRKPAYYNPQMRDVLVKTLAMQARWQGVKLRELGYPALVFVDDPAASALGVSTYITLSREQLVEDLEEITGEIHRSDALAGAHSCAGVDWSIFMDAGFDVISFDAYEYFPSLLGHIDSLRSFLERGGALAWGIVPTSYKINNEQVSHLRMMLEQQVGHLLAKGIPEELLRTQTLIAPSCGTGTLLVEEAEKIYKIAASLSLEMQGR